MSVALAALSPVMATAASTPTAAATATATATATGVSFDGKTYTNRLIHSHDPYLLMHAHNPVDWYPWGPAAIARARRENKPIFLSIGYSTCYWCHVAERELYADPKIAGLMNRWFVNIKVDREQRPDLDRIYMLARQIIAGGGGWPNNVFLTPELKPFFAGSYFPPHDQGQRPGFPEVLATLHKAWTNEHAKVLEAATGVYQTMQQVERQMSSVHGAPPAPARWLQQAVRQAATRFDAMDGGFPGNSATQFPQQPVLAMLLADYRHKHDARSLAMVTSTLQAMAEGGVMDQLGGGFHRYSIEPDWSIPHFEKMLDDNAQLLGLYAQAYASTRQPLFKQVALRTAHYLVSTLQAPGGGFYSAEDSQVDGVEGASHVWTRARIDAVLGTRDAERFLTLYALTPIPPDHTGQSSPGDVLRLDRNKAMPLADKQQLAPRIDALAPLRDRLLAARRQRPQPARDEKIVTAENALAIRGFLQAGQRLKEPALTRTAIDTGQWFWTHAFDAKSGLLRHQFYHGHAGTPGFLDDYALLGQAFLALHAATGDALWRTRAQQLADAMLQRFARPDGSLRPTSNAADLLVAPPVEGDQMRPSGQSAAVALLLGLSANGGQATYGKAAYRALSHLATQVDAQPYAWGSLLTTLTRPSLLAALNQAKASIKTSHALPSSADHVHATAQLTSSGALRVAIEIDKGYHINANPASDPYLIPTRLAVDHAAGLKVHYPRPETFKTPFAPQGLAVYSGHVVLRAQLPPTTPAPPQVTVRVQACNDQYCLVPARLQLPVTVTR